MLFSCLLCFGLDGVYDDMLALTSSFNLELVSNLRTVILWLIPKAGRQWTEEYLACDIGAENAGLLVISYSGLPTKITNRPLPRLLLEVSVRSLLQTSPFWQLLEASVSIAPKVLGRLINSWSWIAEINTAHADWGGEFTSQGNSKVDCRRGRI